MGTEENEMNRLRKSRAGESYAETDIEELAEELAQRRSLPPKVIEFRRILRQYLDEGMTVFEAQTRAIADIEDTAILQDPNSNILDYLE